MLSIIDDDDIIIAIARSLLIRSCARSFALSSLSHPRSLSLSLSLLSRSRSAAHRIVTTDCNTDMNIVCERDENEARYAICDRRRHRRRSHSRCALSRCRCRTLALSFSHAERIEHRGENDESERIGCTSFIRLFIRRSRSHSLTLASLSLSFSLPLSLSVTNEAYLRERRGERRITERTM